MALSQLPQDLSGLSDGQTVEVIGPDGITRKFLFDLQTKSFNIRDSELFVPTKHGDTHISTDPIPTATCDTPGLMAANDKCRLDSLSQLRLGVLGYSGAGMPDDGGWLQEDIILAAGNNGFLSIERVGNVVRFTVTPPLPYSCNCESCSTLYWVFDETEPFSVRPPTCNGKLPGVNAYGEVKFYMMPESLIVDPANPTAALNTKGNYPSMVFKRYNNSTTPGLASFELVLQRDSVNKTQSQVGWSFLPGSAGVVECVWFTGKDDNGNLLKFSLDPKSEPGILGALLSNGNLITKRMAIITGYVATTPSNNLYFVKYWDVLNATTIGEEFTATNVWSYVNAGTGTLVPSLDGAESDLLAVGTLVDLWMFEVGQSSSGPIHRFFINKEPVLKARDLWSKVGVVEFGDVASARSIPQSADATGGAESMAVDEGIEFDDFESSKWGLANAQDIRFYDNGGGDIESYIIKNAVIDTDIKAMRVTGGEFITAGTTGQHQEPVILWNRQSLEASLFAVIDIGFPADIPMNYPLMDVLWGPREAHGEVFTSILRSRNKSLVLDNPSYSELPNVAKWQCVYPPSRAGITFDQSDKSVERVAGVGLRPAIYTTGTNNLQTGDIVKLITREYTTNALRITAEKIGTEYFMTMLSGILGMDTLYQGNLGIDLDDWVRGFQPGYVVSPTYSQDGLWDGTGQPPASNISGFLILGGSAGTGTERWNRLEVMIKDNRMWVWWNGLLVTPSTQASSVLQFPVNITTQFFPFFPAYDVGKFSLRMWPGSILRRVTLMTQTIHDNEYQEGQIILG